MRESLNRRALAVTRDNSVARFGLGLTLAENGRYEEAVEQYREAIRHEPHPRGTHFAMGNALWRLGRREEAVARVPEDMIRAANLIGDEQEVRRRLGVYRAAGVQTLMIDAAGRDFREKLETLGRLMDVVRSLD